MLKTNEEHFILKIWEKLRTAILNLNFTGSYKKSLLVVMYFGTAENNNYVSRTYWKTKITCP